MENECSEPGGALGEAGCAPGQVSKETASGGVSELGEGVKAEGRCHCNEETTQQGWGALGIHPASLGALETGLVLLMCLAQGRDMGDTGQGHRDRTGMCCPPWEQEGTRAEEFWGAGAGRSIPPSPMKGTPWICSKQFIVFFRQTNTLISGPQ